MLNLSHNRTDSVYPAVVTSADGQQVAVAWQDTAEGNADIWLTTSNDGGVTWTSPVNVSRTPGASTLSAVALQADGTVQLVWLDASHGNTQVFYCRFEEETPTPEAPIYEEQIVIQAGTREHIAY